MEIELQFFDCQENKSESHSLPVVKTMESACANLIARFHKGKVKVYDHDGFSYEREVIDGAFKFYPGERCMIPTGWRVLIPHGYQIKVLPRSGLALKHGITLINTPGTIDSDYTDELIVLLVNHSSVPYNILEGDSVAQIEVMENVMRNVTMSLQEDENIIKEHKETSDRDGGFGSTGR